ncbi:MAG: ABC transporter permease, partial [Acidobacteriota bacterium]
MLLYQLRLGWKSLLRTPVLSTLTLLAVALGVAVATSAVAVNHLLDEMPLEENEGKLFAIRLDGWSADRPFDDDLPEAPPNQLTYQDAVGLLESDVPTRHVAMYKARAFVFADDPEVRPYSAMLRLTTRDFFAMFEVPFRFGGGWGKDADRPDGRAVVLDHATNQRLFGGEDSVGREVRIRDRTFTVSGVLAPWRPKVKIYDPNNGGQQSPENVYLPFAAGINLEMQTGGNTSGWSSYEPTWEGRLGSEAVWIQFWAQLDDPEQIAAYQSWLDAYTDGQRQLDRFGRPNNNWIQPLEEFHIEHESVPSEVRSLRMIALLFLLVCSVNLIGLLLGKFLARAPEVGVRRALGASRWQIFSHYLIECLLVSIAGGALGLVAAHFVLGWMAGGIGPSDINLAIDLPMA